MWKNLDHAAFGDQKPGVHVDRADNALSDMFPIAGIDRFVREAIVQAPVAVEIVRAKQTNASRDRLAQDPKRKAPRERGANVLCGSS